MFFIASCSQCGKKWVPLSVALSVTYRVLTCGACHHMIPSEVQYHFCDLACFAAWLTEKNVLVEGFPCPMFHDAGDCFQCGGSGRLKLGERVAVPGTEAAPAATEKAP